MRKLDKKDMLLLYELDMNSRQTYKQLAKKARLSKTATIHRVQKYLNMGIIKTYHTVVDIGKLGLTSFRLYLRLQNANTKIENELISWFKSRPEVTWIVSIDGKYQLGVLILVKEIKEMNELWKELLEKYRNYIEERFLAIMTGAHYYSRAFIVGQSRNEYEKRFISEPTTPELSDTDKAILKILSSDARFEALAISKKLGITAKTVISSIRRMEKKKYIIAYKTVFDLEKLGLQYFKVNIALNNVNEETLRALKQFVKEHPNIIYMDEVLGGEDFEIELNVKDIKELRKIIEEIKDKFSTILKNYETMHFYKEHKYLFLPQTI